MTTRRVILKHAVNLVVTPQLPASHTRQPVWQQTWDDLYIEVSRHVRLPGEATITREEAWYLLRVRPDAWALWLDLFRAEGCREIAVFAAIASKDQLRQALRVLEAEISSREAA